MHATVSADYPEAHLPLSVTRHIFLPALPSVLPHSTSGTICSDKHWLLLPAAHGILCLRCPLISQLNVTGSTFGFLVAARKFGSIGSAGGHLLRIYAPPASEFDCQQRLT